MRSVFSIASKLRFDDDVLNSDTLDDNVKTPKQKRKIKPKIKTTLADNQPSIDVEPVSSESTQEPKLHFNKADVSQVDVIADNEDNSTSHKDSKLKFCKDEVANPITDVNNTQESSKVSRLDRKNEKYSKKLERTRSKLPTKRERKKQRVYDEAKNKAKTKIQFEDTIVPIGEAKWNKSKKQSFPDKATSTISSMTVTKVHAKVHQVESQNVGVEAAHKAELMGESAYRGVKKSASSAYCYYKNRHYRKASKLEVKSIRTRMKLDYEKALQDSPVLVSGKRSRLKHGKSVDFSLNKGKDRDKIKKNPLSRYLQKRRIKRQYAASLKNAKATGKAAKAGVGLTQRAFNTITRVVRRNPIFMLKAGLLALVVIMIMSLFTMCGMMFSNTTTLIGIASYLAEDSCIDNAALSYSEWEVELQIQINDIQTDFPGFDEYRFFVDIMGHNPLELMAYLTAVHHNFTYPDIQAFLRELFDEQYQLTITPSIEIRQGVDDYGYPAPYEWRVLTTTLTTRSLTSIIHERLTTEQRQHYDILMMTSGARQIVGSPFDFNWLPFVTSHYGWRIHPISGNPELHRGIDIGLPTGTPILAAHDGVVTFANAMGGYGNVVFIVSHCGEIETRYAHCDTILVSVGQEVSMGDVIATVGSTGNSTGAHLHFEILRMGIYLNPIFFSMTNATGESPGFGNPGLPMGDGTFEALLELANSVMGFPYVWGASGPNAFDCSGLIYWLLTRSGAANVYRTTAQGFYNKSQPVSPSDARPGDLIFFEGTFSSPRRITHVSIYLGGGRKLHTGGNPNGVEIVNLNSPFWQRHFAGFGRIADFN